MTDSGRAGGSAPHHGLVSSSAGRLRGAGTELAVRLGPSGGPFGEPEDPVPPPDHSQFLRTGDPGLAQLELEEGLAIVSLGKISVDTRSHDAGSLVPIMVHDMRSIDMARRWSSSCVISYIYIANVHDSMFPSAVTEACDSIQIGPENSDFPLPCPDMPDRDDLEKSINIQ